MAPTKKDEESPVDQLCSITGVSRVVATNLLEACDNNLEMALNMQMEGLITDSNGVPALNPDDNVRAPIPQKREILVEGPDQLAYTFRGRSRIGKSVFDKFRDFEAETKRQEEELMEECSTSGASSSSSSSGSTNKRKMKTLEDLFRPPLDLMYRGNFNSAREVGISSNKWLLVNVQNSTEFPCQVLNRDVWSNAAVKTIIQEHFIFWQIYHDSEEGVRYMTFYQVNDWPYIAIIDPRTGEKLLEWQKLDAKSFCELIAEFLSTHPSMEDTRGPFKMPPKKKLKSSDSIIEADESAQLEAAIRASLAMSCIDKKKKNSSSNDDDFDLDSDDALETFDSDAEGIDVKDSDVEENDVKERDVKEVDEGTKNSNDVKSIEVDGEASKELVNGFIDKETTIKEDESEVVCEADVSLEMESEVERWKLYLGEETDPVSKLMLRMPDGSRESVSMPKSSKLMALVLYVASKGFTNESYELVTNFPKRQLSHLNFEQDTLEKIGLFPQETIFVQKR